MTRPSEGMIADDLVQAIVKIGNTKLVKRMCEPNVMQPHDLKEWMVIRTAMALTLIQKEWEAQNEVQRTEQGDNRNDGLDRGKGIRQVSKKRSGQTSHGY